MRRRRSLEKDGDGNGSEKDSDKLQGERGWHTVSCLGGFSLCSPMRDTPPAATRSAHIARVRARFSLANWSSFATCLPRWIQTHRDRSLTAVEDLNESKSVHQDRRKKPWNKLWEELYVSSWTAGGPAYDVWNEVSEAVTTVLLLAKWSVNEVLINKKLDSLRQLNKPLHRHKLQLRTIKIYQTKNHEENRARY